MKEEELVALNVNKFLHGAVFIDINIGVILKPRLQKPQRVER